MNTLNLFMKFFQTGRGMQQLINRFSNKRKNNGWTTIALLGAGAALSMLAGRNKNMTKSVQSNFVRDEHKSQENPRPQRSNKSPVPFPTNMNFANAEMAKEMIPKFLEEITKEDNSNNDTQEKEH